MKSCLNHVGFTAGCKRCEALNPAAPPAPEIESDSEPIPEDPAEDE